MAADFPSQLSFENMLSYMFPGFFVALSLFMVLDILSPFHLTQYVASDITTLINFYGILLLGGTIIGVIVDGIHHRFIERVYFRSLEDYMGIKLNDLVEYHKALLLCSHEAKNCHECKFRDPHIRDDTKIYFLFGMADIDKCIALREYLTKSVYYYSEFYANTFIALIPFTFVAPIYLVKELHIDHLMALFGGFILAVLTILCLDFAWMAYRRWISALYFAFCRCPKSNSGKGG